jgi:hypothetical protein
MRSRSLILFTILKYGRATLSDWLSVLLEKYWSREEYQKLLSRYVFSTLSPFSPYYRPSPLLYFL